MGREIRKVPANWEHPKRRDGRYEPMFNEFYGTVLKEWLKEHNAWLDGTHPDLIRDPALKDEYPFYAMWGGNPPDVGSYLTKEYSEDELTHIQLYETTSEGTPMSPVFPKEDFEKLCEWAEKNASTFADAKTTKENWMRMLSDGSVHHTEGNITFI